MPQNGWLFCGIFFCEKERFLYYCVTFGNIA